MVLLLLLDLLRPLGLPRLLSLLLRPSRRRPLLLLQTVALFPNGVNAVVAAGLAQLNAKHRTAVHAAVTGGATADECYFLEV